MDWFLPVLARMERFDELTAEGGFDAATGPVDVVGSYDGGWSVSIIPANAITKSQKHIADEDDLRKKIAAFETLGLKTKQPLQEIETVLAGYKYEWATTLEDKLTAGRVRTGLQPAVEGESFEYTPVNWDAEFEGASEDAKQAGILLHAAFELLDFQGTNEPGWASREAERIAGFIDLPSDWDVKRLTESFAGLKTSPIGDALESAGRIWVERAFSVKLPIGELSSGIVPEPQVKDWIMLQGRIDLVAIKDGKACLIDYKSDMVPTGQLEEHSRRYIPQLAAYANALERIGGYEVACILYFIRHGVAINMTVEVAGFDFASAVLNACTKTTGDE